MGKHWSWRPPTSVSTTPTSAMARCNGRDLVPTNARLAISHEPTDELLSEACSTRTYETGYSDLIPVESEFISRSPPMVGPKPAS